MAQLGLTLGPRHARLLKPAWGQSFAKNISDEEKTAHDTDCIGAASLFWALAQSSLPKDLMEEIQQKYEKTGLPSLATRNVAEGERPAKQRGPGLRSSLL